MKASEALITWDTEPEPCICISQLGEESRSSRELTYSGGAAWQSRREIKGREELACVMADFVYLTVTAGLPPKMVHEAFLEIDEYRDALKAAVARPRP